MNPNTHSDIEVTTAAEVEPGQMGLITHKASGPLFVTKVTQGAGVFVSALIAGAMVASIPATPDALDAAIGDGFNVAKDQTLALHVVNTSAEKATLRVTLRAINLNAEPIPIEQLGKVLGQVDAQNLAASAPQVSALAGSPANPLNLPTNPQGYVGNSQVSFAPVGPQPMAPGVGMPGAPVAPMPTIAQASQAGVFGAGGPQPMNMSGQGSEGLTPTSTDQFAQHFAPVVRDKNDPRPPPPKTANVQMQPGVRMSSGGAPVMGPTTSGGAPGMSFSGVGTMPPSNSGMMTGNRAATGSASAGSPADQSGSAGNMPPMTFRENVEMRTLNRAPQIEQPKVQFGGNVPPGAVMNAPASSHANPDYVGFAPTQLTSITPLGASHRPVVMGHSLAKSVQNMLERLVPIVRAHREAVNGVLNAALSLNPLDYMGREAQLWENGSVVAWLTPGQIQSLHIIMGAGQGAVEHRAGQHDALPYLVEAFALAMNPQARLASYQAASAGTQHRLPSPDVTASSPPL